MNVLYPVSEFDFLDDLRQPVWPQVSGHFPCVRTSRNHCQLPNLDWWIDFEEVPLTIPDNHPALTVASVSHDLSHLNAFPFVARGEGHAPGTDLQVQVKLSNHVFTKRTLHGQSHDTRDHRDTKRTFDPDRHKMSLRLPGIITQGFADNELCFVSRDFGGHEDLVIELKNGDTWLIVFCFQPLKEGVVMEILSLHPWPVPGNPKHNHLVYFARMCLFEQGRVPKN